MIIARKFKNFKNSLETKSHIKNFYKNYQKKPTNGKRILIYAGIGQMYISYLEILMYHLFVKEGYQVDFLVYDEDIKIFETLTKDVADKQNEQEFINKNVRNAKKLHEVSNVNYQYINTKRPIVEEEIERVATSIERIFSYKKDGINLGEIVKGAMYRYYKSLTFGSDQFEVAKKMFHTALTNFYEVKERNETNDYDYVMFSHGIYVSWEPVSEFCIKNNQDFIVYDRAKTKNTININFNQTSADWDFTTAWNRFNEKELNEDEKNKVYTYLKERELQKTDVYAYNFSERSKDVEVLKKELGIPLKSKVISFFSNLIWDAANVSRDIAFDSAFECLTGTIEKYKDNKDIHIILRSHPAEMVVGTKESYGNLLKNYFKNKLPENVTILDAEMKINSFSVIDMSDIGVVNTSTVGLEFALLGKPIILISETNYRNKGFTYDVESQEEYFSTLEDLIRTSKLKKDQVALAEKYFYMMMFEYQHRIPLEYEDNGRFKKYAFKHIDEIPEENVIYKIINRIKVTNNEDFVFWD